jgi:light-regulated signal transduction histidine kinase (bacteriophytochrome)
VTTSPPFGQADLTNCERELIHLAGSVQPHGFLLVLREPELRIVQASANVEQHLGLAAAALLGRPPSELGGDFDVVLRALAGTALDEPVPRNCRLAPGGHERRFEVAVHRVADACGSVLVAEFEPTDANAADVVDVPAPQIVEHLTRAVQRFGATTTIGTLADAVVRSVRALTGYDRVMVYKFDPDGHGQVIAEARDARLEPLLGHHYPATDIPQRARELYLRNRLRVLVDVHYTASPLVPARDPDTGADLDMSMCQLRSMSPLHLQYLKNMGVTATLVASLVREGALWGLIACHHYRPRNLRLPVRAACDLIAEVASTRIAAIEHYAHAQVAIQVRRLEQRLVEATSTEGDWRLALFRTPQALLQPLDATGAVLCYEGELLTAGESPSTPELRALLQWIDGQVGAQSPAAPFACSSVARAQPALESLTPTASGVLAVKLSTTRPDYLLWLRKEQLHNVTWAGDPSKPMLANDPLQLSPRRSFAAWSEIVRGTAQPWTRSEVAMARAFGAALADIIAQVNAVRLLIVEHQRAQVVATVASAVEPVLVADADRRVLFANDSLRRLARRDVAAGTPLASVADWFVDRHAAGRMLDTVCHGHAPWRGELALRLPARDGDAAAELPVQVRAEVVPTRDGRPLGFILVFDDRSGPHRAADARAHLEEALVRAGFGAAAVPARDALTQAILANASLAAMDIADADAASPVPALLAELEASMHRATSLVARIRDFARGA